MPQDRIRTATAPTSESLSATGQQGIQRLWPRFWPRFWDHLMPRLGQRNAGLLFFAAHIAVWTTIGVLSSVDGSLHHDMTEAFAWGQEWQLGYDKHPPFYAWIAALWFSVLPRNHAMFYLLASTNAAVGLAGVWMLAGRFLAAPERWIAVMLSALTPFFTIYALKYNANSAQLATWPWITYFFVRSLESRSAWHGAALGLLSAAAFLTKYYSVVLLGSCAIAGLLHPAARAYLRSPAPYIAGATFLLAITPHVWWSIANNFPTIDYAVSRTNFPVFDVRLRAFVVVVATFASLGVAAAVFVAAFGRHSSVLVRRAIAATFARETAWLGVLAWGPLILTLAANWFGNVRIGDQFLIPAFAALPVAFLFLSRLKSASSERRMMATIVAVLWCGAVVAATPVGFYTFKSTETGANEPRRAIAMRVTELWRQSYGRRLEIVSGTEAFATATSFYSADRPSYLQLGNPAASPWVTREKKKASGFAIICTVDPDDCRGLTAAYDSKNSRRMTIAMPRRYLGQTLPDFEIEVIFVPPAGVAP